MMPLPMMGRWAAWMMPLPNDGQVGGLYKPLSNDGQLGGLFRSTAPGGPGPSTYLLSITPKIVVLSLTRECVQAGQFAVF